MTWHFHDWSNWEDPERTASGKRIQQRKCRKCNKVRMIVIVVARSQ